MKLTSLLSIGRQGRAVGKLALLLSVLLLGNCNDDDDTDTPAAPPTVKLATSPTLGSYLTDKDNNTLYYFARDLSGQNACSGNCAAVWPVFYSADIVAGTGLNAADFTIQNTAAGQPQLLYKGWPLYYYAPATNGQNVREQPGETRGSGVGGVWFVAKPDYSLLLGNTTVTNKTTSQSTAKTFLTDTQGRTLYTFAPDRTSPGTQATNCSGNCITNWPVYLEAGRTLPASLNAADFGVITRNDGPGGATRQQTTYKGVPLYYFANDNNTRARVEGDGVGNVWAVAAP
jgi:predicted lipoprotein with Yx(FWY)xxD motif